jgi:hypothetical protein
MFNRRLEILMVTVFAMLMLGVVASSAAAEWQVDGKPITITEGSLATEAEGESELSDLKALGGTAVTILCKEIFDGTVGASESGEITEVLNTSKELISSTPLSGLALLCTNVLNCASSEVWPIDLPWSTGLEAMASEPHLLDRLFGFGGKEPGWEVVCTILGTKVTDDCTGRTSGKVENSSEKAVLEIASPEAPIESQKAACSLGGAGAGDFSGEDLILLVSGKTLTARPGDIEMLNWEDQEFGQVSVKTPETRIFAIENQTEEVTYGEIGLINEMGSAFSLDSDGCEGKKFAPNNQCEIDIEFGPKKEGETYLARIETPYTVKGEKIIMLSFLRGEGVK